MAAMPINWVEDILPRSFDPEWDEKYDDRLQWRGTNTGMWHDEDTLWHLSQRSRLVEWATNAYHENVTVLPAPKDNKRAVGKGVLVRKAKYSSSMLDVAFANAPLSCAPKTCEHLKEVFEFRKPQDWKTAGKYKYIIDVSVVLAFYLPPLLTHGFLCRWTETDGQVGLNDLSRPTHSSSNRRYTPNGLFSLPSSFSPFIL